MYEKIADFLRFSRSAVDDSITEHLNALLTPARAGFDPSSTNTRQSVFPSTANHETDGSSCRSFTHHVLFPSWQARSDILNYCTGVATSPDPEDPVAAVREMELAKDQDRVVDERLDPYSARFFPVEPRTERLALLLRNERGVESIVRSRTWGLVTERCGGAQHWEDALGAWRKDRQ